MTGAERSADAAIGRATPSEELTKALSTFITPEMEARQEASRARIRERNARLVQESGDPS